MAINKQLIDFVIKEVQNNSAKLEHNQILFEIYEGDLLKYIEIDLAHQFSPETYKSIKPRIAPINVLHRIVDKLSSLYAKPPKRIIVDGTDSDRELLSWYEKSMDFNSILNIANELFNLHKTVTLEPYTDEQIPKLRAVPSDRSMMLSTNFVDPTKPTIWVKFAGEMVVNGQKEKILFIYTKDDFIPVTMSGVTVDNVLLDMENVEAINPIEEIPAVYINRSYYSINPPSDSDMLRMTKIIPILVSDLNFAVCYQAFSIMYGIDVDTQNLRMSPNAFWAFKSDPTTNTKPEIGVIKPTVDITQVLGFIQAQLSFWLNSKNIRPGTVGGLSTENFASGISKMIDEMDTSEDRQKQVSYFQKAEEQLWTLIIKKMHPYWKSQGLIDQPLDWSPNVKIQIEFQEQLPLVKRSEILKDVIIEIEKRLTTRKRALKTINPQMTDDEVDQLLKEIDEETTVEIELPEDEDPEDDNAEGEALPVQGEPAETIQ